MPRIDYLEPIFVEEIPRKLEDGKLYIAEDCKAVLHNCCCGCGEEVSTPYVSTEYRMVREGGGVSIYPSVGNHDFPCRSHYWIRANRVLWSEPMSRSAIDAGRAYDRRIKRHVRRGRRWWGRIINQMSRLIKGSV